VSAIAGNVEARACGERVAGASGDRRAPWIPALHVVLVRPEIPNNTGNIGRTCVGVGAALHLVHPLGFELSEKACRRAGLDYWPRLRLHEYADEASYRSAHRARRAWMFSTKGRVPVDEARIEPGDHLVFGPETRGLPEAWLESAPERCCFLPMRRGERSLNLATAVCAVLYEGVRQLRARGVMSLDGEGRLCLSNTFHP